MQVNVDIYVVIGLVPPRMECFSFELFIHISFNFKNALDVKSIFHALTHMFSLSLAQKQKHTEACFLYFGSFTFVLLEPHIKLSHAHNIGGAFERVQCNLGRA